MSSTAHPSRPGTAAITPTELEVGRLMPPAPANVAPGDIAVGVVIGRASEYFDFFVFGIASVLVFPAVFFPFADRLDGTLYSFALLALAFVVRPIGTLVGMQIQRRYGRSAKLTMALFLLGCSTAGMALLPGYQSIGAWAIGLLALFRIGQGLALGGSWDGLPSLLALNAPEGRAAGTRCSASSVRRSASSSPAACSPTCGAIWPQADFLDWGWRYPFFAAFAINVVALFARLRLVVTHEYDRDLKARELEPCSVRELLGSQGSNVVLGAFTALASYALFHLVTVFPLSWVMLYSDQVIGEFLALEMLGAVLAAAAMPLSGLLADRIGRRSTLGTLAVLIGLFSLVAPWLLGGGNLGQNIFILVGSVLLGFSYGQSAGTVTANFLPRLRYTGAALTADMAWLIGAAFAPLVALGLSARFGLVSVSIYLLSGVVCTLIALRINRRRQAA